MRRAFAVSGVAFIILAIVVIALNYLVISSMMVEKASSDVSEIDRVYYETVDVKRSLFDTRAANVFTDALQDAAATALSRGVAAYTVARPVEAIAVQSGDPDNYVWKSHTKSIGFGYDAQNGYPVTSIEVYVKPDDSGEIQLAFLNESYQPVSVPGPHGRARVSGGVGQKVKIWVDDPDNIDWTQVKWINIEGKKDDGGQNLFYVAFTGSKPVYTVYYRAGEEVGHPSCVVGGINKYGLTTGADYFVNGSYGQSCLKFEGCEREDLEPPTLQPITSGGTIGGASNLLIQPCSDQLSQQYCQPAATCGEPLFRPVCVVYTPVNCPPGSYYAGFDDENGVPVCSYTQGYQTEGCGIENYTYEDETNCSLSPGPEGPDNQPIGKPVLKDACDDFKTWAVDSTLGSYLSRFSREVTAVIPEQVTVDYDSRNLDVTEVESTKTRCVFDVNATIPFTIKSGTVSKTRTVNVKRRVEIELLPPVKGNVLYHIYDGYEEGNETCAVCHTDCNGFYYEEETPVLAENDPAFCCNARSQLDVQRSIDLCEQAKAAGEIDSNTDCSKEGGTGNCLVTYPVERHYYKTYREMREYARIKVYDPDNPERIDYGDRAGDYFHIDTYVGVDRELAGVDRTNRPKECSDETEGGPRDTFTNQITETYPVTGHGCYDLSPREVQYQEYTEILDKTAGGHVDSVGGYPDWPLRIGYVYENGEQGFFRSYVKFSLPGLEDVSSEVGVPKEALGIKSAKLILTISGVGLYTFSGEPIAAYRTDSNWNSYTDLGWENPPFGELAGITSYAGQKQNDNIRIDVTPAIRRELEEQKQTGDDSVSLGIRFVDESIRPGLGLTFYPSAQLSVTYAPVFSHPICSSKAPGQKGTVITKGFAYWETLQSDAPDQCRTDALFVGTSTWKNGWINRGLIKFNFSGMPTSDVSRVELVVRPRELHPANDPTVLGGKAQLYVQAYSATFTSGSSSGPSHIGETYDQCEETWSTLSSGTFLDEEFAEEDKEILFDITKTYMEKAQDASDPVLRIMLRVANEFEYPGYLLVCNDTAGLQDCDDRVFLRIYQGDKVSYYNVVDSYLEQPVCTSKKCYDTRRGGIGIYANNLTEPLYSSSVSLQSAGTAYETVSDTGYYDSLLKVGKGSKNRALIQFNVSKLNIPEGAVLKSAYLVLSPEAVSSPKGKTFVVNAYRLDRSKASPNDISKSPYSNINDLPGLEDWQKMGSADVTGLKEKGKVWLDITPEVDYVKKANSGPLVLVMLKDEKEEEGQANIMTICDTDCSSLFWGNITYSYYFEGERKPDLTVKISKVERAADGTVIYGQGVSGPGYLGEPLNITLDITNQGTAPLPKGSSFQVSIKADNLGISKQYSITLSDPLDIGETMPVTYKVTPTGTPDVSDPKQEYSYLVSAEIGLMNQVDELNEKNNYYNHLIPLRYRKITFEPTGYYNAAKRIRDDGSVQYVCDSGDSLYKMIIGYTGTSNTEYRAYLQYNETGLRNLISGINNGQVAIANASLLLNFIGHEDSTTGNDVKVGLVEDLYIGKYHLVSSKSEDCYDLSFSPKEVFNCYSGDIDGCAIEWQEKGEYNTTVSEDYNVLVEMHVKGLIPKNLHGDYAAVNFVLLDVGSGNSGYVNIAGLGNSPANLLTIYGYCPSGTCPTGLEGFA